MKSNLNKNRIEGSKNKYCNLQNTRSTCVFSNGKTLNNWIRFLCHFKKCITRWWSINVTWWFETFHICLISSFLSQAYSGLHLFFDKCVDEASIQAHERMGRKADEKKKNYYIFFYFYFSFVRLKQRKFGVHFWCCLCNGRLFHHIYEGIMIARVMKRKYEKTSFHNLISFI